MCLVLPPIVGALTSWTMVQKRGRAKRSIATLLLVASGAGGLLSATLVAALWVSGVSSLSLWAAVALKAGVAGVLGGGFGVLFDVAHARRA